MPPMDPSALMQMLASLGGGPAGPGGPGGPPPGLPGPGGPPPGAMGAGPQPPGPISPALGQEGLDALNDIIGGQPNGEVRVDRAKQGLDVVHRIINALVPIVGIENMELSKQLYTIGRQVADVRINLNKQNESEAPPPEKMIGGISGTGLPGLR